MTKKAKNWNNIINDDRGVRTAPNTVHRSIHDRAPDHKPHGTHVRGWKGENQKERFKRSHPGVTHGDLHYGFGRKPTA